MLLILNISHLDSHHGRYVVEANTNPKRDLEFSWRIVPRMSKFTEKTFCPLKIARTEVHELGWILAKDYRLSLAKPFGPPDILRLKNLFRKF